MLVSVCALASRVGSTDRARPLSLRVVLLGSGGWIPTAKRETCCLYVRKGRNVLVLDAGTGLRHLVSQPDLLAGSESLVILLSHFHLDHVVGLGYLPALELSTPPEIWGPGESLYGAPTAEVLGRVLQSPFFTPGLSAVAGRVEDLSEGHNQLGSFSIVARRQDLHSEPSLAFRVDDRLAYCSDTGADDGNAAFAAGCELLFHDAWTADGDPAAGLHTSAREAGRIAHDAGVAELVLIHVNPLLADADLEAAARTEFDETKLGTDLLEFVVE